MILFKSIEKVDGKEYHGFLSFDIDDCTATDICWAVDELGFDPYSLIYREVDLLPAGCWLSNPDKTFVNENGFEEIDNEDDEEIQIFEEFRFAVRIECERKQGWYCMKRDDGQGGHVLVEYSEVE